MKPNTVIIGWPYSWRQEGRNSWKTFIQTVRTVAACHMALMVPKGINFYPESNHKVVFTAPNAKFSLSNKSFFLFRSVATLISGGLSTTVVCSCCCPSC